MDLRKIRVNPLPKEVEDWCRENSVSTSTKFVAYLQYIRGEMVQRMFATRVGKGKVRITEVMRHATGKHSPIVRNLISGGMNGYRAVYKAEDYVIRSWGYPITVFPKSDFDVWFPLVGAVGFGYVTINPQAIFTADEFKYCGYTTGSIISYLNAYRKDKNVEFFGKMGLQLSPVLMNKAKKDGKFRRFLWDNHNAIALYGVQAGLYAFKNGITVEEARRACYEKNKLHRLVAERISAIKGTSIDRKRLLEYVDSNNISYASYNDYLTALITLKYDLTDTKNLYPKDFKAMHDLRTSEYDSHNANIDRKRRAQLYEDFEQKSKAAQIYEVCNDTYSLIVPRDISELVREGRELSHCVGKMGYDKKMADGVSLIMFCRKTSDINTPYVTVEYRLDTNKLNQCYGYSDSKPNDDVLAFVNEWAAQIREIRLAQAREVQNETCSIQI